MAIIRTIDKIILFVIFVRVSWIMNSVGNINPK